MTSIYYFFIAVISVILLKICKTKKIFVDYKIEKHKRYASKLNNYSIGGIIFYIFFLLLFVFESFLGINFFISMSIIFLIGFLSDIKILKNAVTRFFLQLFTLVYFVFFTDFQIPLSNIEIIDMLLRNYFFNKFFTIFCLLILINGNNFIDGINTLLITNNLIICLFLIYFFSKEIYFTPMLNNYFFIILYLLFLNLRGVIILGDSGAYTLAFFLGTFLIDLALNNHQLSPFFIISLIWYPCYELLFSIFRRLNSSSKTYKPDTKHLHQLVYFFFINKKFKSEYSHLLVSIVINGYCLVSLIFNYFLGYKNIIVIMFLLVNIFIYSFFYYFLKKYHKNNF